MAEPIAIVGIGCHYPGGATSPRRFWELLRDGVDATRDVPADRWDAATFHDRGPDGKAGKAHVARGGFLERLDGFDASFFGISPREAVWMDPQQRLLLRTAWEALEDAGLVPSTLRGSDTGVFVGGFTLDYQLLQNYGVLSRYELAANSATGMMMTMLANRLSHVLDLRGPSMAVDTACSGSLVAVHLAVRSLRDGECSLAVVGGANAMIAPTMTIAESKGGFLAADGRCKTFDAAADGYARGEGAGVVVLKPLSAARADGDPVYALIRGTAVGQDGHTTGITVPNGDAQEAAMRAAYRAAGVDPGTVGYVEAHGTGTPVGDPVEARAIGRVVSAGRAPGSVCRVGSVKTNIGHTEAAAGVAGLTKAALVLHHGEIPPHLNLHDPNPDIAFDELRLSVPVERTAWPRAETPRVAGVNSFGFGGTNAHVVLQEAPPPPAPVPPPSADRPHLLALSARSGDALVELARAHRDLLSGPDADLRDVGWTAARHREHHDHRRVVVATSADAAAVALDADAGAAAARVPAGDRPRVAFVCTGMGPQWWAMGRELLATEPVFRAEVQRCDAALARHTGWSLLERMTADEDASRMADTAVAQPANFAVQVGLAALWRAYGVEPDAVVGHSTGEIAAQYLSGVLSFDDAVTVVHHRSRLQRRTAGSGRMLAVGMTPQTLDRAVSDAGPGVSVAAVNGPSAVTLSGEAAALERMAAQLAAFGVFHRFLAVDVPYHSHLMDPLRDELLAGLAGLAPRRGDVPLYSTVTGTRIDGSGADAHYWWQNVRGTVLFAAAFEQMVADGHTVFVELGPHPVLTGPMTELLGPGGGVVAGSLRRAEPERASLLTAVGTLWTAGVAVDWDALYPDGGNRVPLPTYPWQPESYWAESREARQDRLYAPVHPLLGRPVDAADPTWEIEPGPDRLPWLADHRVGGDVLLPGAAFVEMALAAGAEQFGADAVALTDVRFDAALLLGGESDPRVRTVLRPDEATVEISGYRPSAPAGARWTRHARARLHSRTPARRGPDPDAVRRACDTHLTHDEFYARTERAGFRYGPAFRAVRSADIGPGRAVARVRAPDVVAADVAHHHLHPSLLDAAFQVLLAAAGDGADGSWLPVGLDRVHPVARASGPLRVIAEIVAADRQDITGDLWIVDDDGAPVAVVEGFRARSLGTGPPRDAGMLHETVWEPRERADDADAPGTWLILGDGAGLAGELAARLTARGGTAVRPGPGVAVADVLAGLPSDGTVTRIVHLAALDEHAGARPDPDAVVRRDTLAVVRLIRAVAAVEWTTWPRLWLVTRGAQAVGDRPGPCAPGQAALWGLGRVIGHQEFPTGWGGLADLDPGPLAGQATPLFDEIAAAPDGEDQVAFRDGVRFVPRLRPLHAPSSASSAPLPPPVRRDGCYVVTGGLGALGLLAARFLVDAGATRLVLLARTPLPDRTDWPALAADDPRRAAVDGVRELERRGATVQTVAVDVADERAMAGWLAAHRARAGAPVRGVVHAAGVVRDELLVAASEEAFEQVLRPKVGGAWLLHRLLADEPLELFVLFSSVGSTIASAGQGAYAAGNAFCDALAGYRRARGLPAVSIGWGPWSVGMVADRNLQRFYTDRGIELITPETGLRVLGRALGRAPAHVVAVGADWTAARAAAPRGALPPLFDELGRDADAAPDPRTASLPAALAAAPSSEHTTIVTGHVRTVVAGVLGMDPDTLGDDPLTALGLDSMMAVEVKQRIEGTAGVDVGVLELLGGATVAELATRVATALGPGGPGAQAESADSAEPAEPADPVLDELDRLLAGLDDDDIEELLGELEDDSASGGEGGRR